jgi:hypothetical protein
LPRSVNLGHARAGRVFDSWPEHRSGLGYVVTEERAVSNFSEVAVSDSGTVLIEQGGTEALTIEAEDNLRPLLTSDVVGDRLELGMRNGARIQTTRPIIYRLTVVNLEGLELSGSSEVTYNEVDADTFSMRLRSFEKSDNLSISTIIFIIFTTG